MYFLFVALSQAIPALRIGYLSTYIVPLVFVLAITLGKEALDDIARRRRDNEANSEGYTILKFDAPSYRDGGIAGRRAGKSKKGRRNDRLGDIREEEEATESDGILPSSAPTTTFVEVVKKSRDLRVGDVLKLGKDQRVPADVVILQSNINESSHQEVPDVPPKVDSDTDDLLGDAVSGSAATTPSPAESTSLADGGDGIGETFIRTDQLDGETDWKLRLGSPLTQSLPTSEFVRLRVTAGKPDKKVNEFIGTVELEPKGTRWGSRQSIDNSQDDLSNQANGAADGENLGGSKSAPLSIDNTAWANTVIASNGTTLAVIIYTGPQTRSALSTSQSRSKTGLLEYEINSLVKILCALTLSLSIILVALEGLEHTVTGKWRCGRSLVRGKNTLPRQA